MFIRRLVCLPFLLLAIPSGAAVWHVDVNSASSGNGTSWATAFRSIQAGVDAAFDDGGGEVWVKEGLYMETPSDPAGSIVMREGVHLYGGFAGDETQRDQRDWADHAVNVNGYYARNNARAYHVFKGANNATLDGFVIVGGEANGPEGDDKIGGGLLNAGVSPTIAHCTFAGNSAGWGGGIANIDGASPLIQECTFGANIGTVNGGGVHCWTQCAARITQCWFFNNQGQNMGGAFLEGDGSSSTIDRCYFLNNSVNNMGGAIGNYQGGQTRITNCVFIGNTVQETPWGGGGVGSFQSLPSITNCSFHNNTSPFGGAVYQSGTTPLPILNSILWGDSTDELRGAFTIMYSDVQGGYEGLGNIDTDPRFLVFTEATALYLDSDSPCIDTGTADGAPEFDLLGVPRPQDIPGVGQDGAGAFDIGAYEFPGDYEGEGAAEGEGEGEGQPNGCFVYCAGQPPTPDADGDGLSQCVEQCLETNPNAIDTDNDGMPDNFEVEYGLNPNNDDAHADLDLDGLTNIEEFLQHSNPNDPGSPGNTYFVSNAGDDVSGNGSAAQPWATLTYALLHVFGTPAAPKRIVAASGDYVESFAMQSWVTIAGALDSAVVIHGTIIGISYSGLENLTITSPFVEAPLLTAENAAMSIEDVTFQGDENRFSTGLYVSGPMTEQTLVEGCTFAQLRAGIEIIDELPTIRRCLFENIAMAGIAVRQNVPNKTLAKSIGDASDPASGWNTFDIDPSAGAKAIINERTEPVLMQNNDWGTDDAQEIEDLIDGEAVYEPFLAAGSGVLAASLFCTIWNARTQAPILNASVQITPSAYAPVTQNKNGVYGFPAIAATSYTVTTSAPGFQGNSRVVLVSSGAMVSVTIPLVSSEAEGEGDGEGEGQNEGEGEGEGQPEPCTGCCCNKSAPVLPTAGQTFIAALSVICLAAFGRRRE